MSATDYRPEAGLHDPDLLKMPGSPRHRQAVDAIGLAAATLLGPEWEIFRDMNWYPSDGGQAIAPDVMVLPTGSLVPPPDARPDAKLNSYRQDKTGGPPAMAVVEVPSETDGYNSLRAKIRRYVEMGTVVYVVAVDGPQTVERFAPQSSSDGGWSGPETWLGRPIPELGGLSLSFDDELVVTMPDGTSARSDRHLLVAASQRAVELERQLRAAGIEPDPPEGLHHPG